MDFNRVRRWAFWLGILAVIIVVGLIKNVAIWLGVLR